MQAFAPARGRSGRDQHVTGDQRFELQSMSSFSFDTTHGYLQREIALSESVG
jgi:hypothetical protein